MIAVKLDRLVVLLVAFARGRFSMIAVKRQKSAESVKRRAPEGTQTVSDPMTASR